MMNQLADRVAFGAEILIVDDDVAVRKSYRLLFEGEGYAVRTARNGEEALRLLAERTPNLILLDVMMPKTNGIAVCQEIRKSDPLVPILFFTAMPSDVSLVRGLGCGADDYIDKSRPPEEFLARVASALRRQIAERQQDRDGECIRLGAIWVDLGAMTVYEQTRPVELLTKGEALVLRMLAKNRGKYISNELLYDAAHGEHVSGDAFQVRKYVTRLRQKLHQAGDMIQNAHGVGYRLME